MIKQIFALGAVCFQVCVSQAAGLSMIDIPAREGALALKSAVWTPCSLAPNQVELGVTVVRATRNCPVQGTDLPLIVMSHGTGGSFLGHHDTASALADAGFVVAALNHPGDTFGDLSRQMSVSVFGTRVADVRRLIDHLLHAWSDQGKLDPARIGIFGFSRGGYTSLVALGATPTWTHRKDLCPPGSTLQLCQEIARGERPELTSADSRIKVAVVVDPLSVFNAEGLKRVRVPVQLWASEHGGDGVTFASVKELRAGLPVPPDWHVASGAGHFAFLAPCSAALSRLAPEICQDNPGFDRVTFHGSFNATVSAFFKSHLTRPPQPSMPR